MFKRFLASLKFKSYIDLVLILYVKKPITVWFFLYI